MTDTPERSMSWGGLVAGLLVGAAVSATISILFAPQSGKQTRDDLNTRLDDLKERLDETARVVTETAKARLAETTADLTQAFEAGRAGAAERAAELRHQVGLD